MARPRKVNLEDTQVAEPGFPEFLGDSVPSVFLYTEIKHVIRGISRNNQANDDGAQPAASIEAYLGSLMREQGWKLFQAYLIGTAPTFYQMLYVFVR